MKTYIIAIKPRYYALRVGQWTALDGIYCTRADARAALREIKHGQYIPGPDESGWPEFRILRTDSRLGRAAIRRTQ